MPAGLQKDLFSFNSNYCTKLQQIYQAFSFKYQLIVISYYSKVHWGSQEIQRGGKKKHTNKCISSDDGTYSKCTDNTVASY